MFELGFPVRKFTFAEGPLGDCIIRANRDRTLRSKIGIIRTLNRTGGVGYLKIRKKVLAY